MPNPYTRHARRVHAARRLIAASNGTGGERGAVLTLPEERIISLIKEGQKEIKLELLRQNTVLAELPLIKQDVNNLKEQLAEQKRRPLQQWQITAGIIGVMLWICGFGVSFAGLFITIINDFFMHH